MSCDPFLMLLKEAKDVMLCSLVVQPFWGLVCAYAVGSPALKVAKSCKLRCGSPCLGPCVYMQHPCTCMTTPTPNCPHLC